MSKDNKPEDQPSIPTYKEQLQQYQQWLEDLETATQESFDKTVIALSSTALAVSMAFLKDFIDIPANSAITPIPTYAWISWVASLIFVLTSLFASQISTRAFKRVVAERLMENQGSKAEAFGKIMAFTTDVFNVLGGILFIIGVIFFAFFVANNL